MAPQSRGIQSQSTPNLITVNPFEVDSPSPLSPSTAATSPSEAASVEDNVDTIADPDEFTLNAGADSDASSSASSTSNPDADDFAANHARTSPNSPDAAHDRPPRPSLYSHSSRSHSHLPPHPALFPPFYNRPPTPLPPSPSLTSLLRPSFSTTTSRPSTPDSSDVETPFAPGGSGAAGSGVGDAGARRPGSSSAATASSFRTQATGSAGPRGSVSSAIRRGAEEGPVPPTAPRVPTYESYGFAIYLFSGVAFLMYVLWAYVPSPILHSLGIRYYPNRWWALAVPAWLVVVIIYIYFALASYNTGYLTLKLESLEVLIDEVGRVAPLGLDKRRKDPGLNTVERQDVARGEEGEVVVGNESASLVPWTQLWNEGTDAVMDVPVGGVCEILYGHGREIEEGEWDGFRENSSS